MRKLRTALGGACLVAALMGCAGTTPALAATGNTGTTKVTVVADENNLKFRVPTVIPFVAASDGALTGPSATTTRIENLSVFGLKVTNVKVTPANGWSHADNVNAADDSIRWSLGPKGAEVSATKANTTNGLQIASPHWNMTYHSDTTHTDDIQLTTAGNVGRVAQDISVAKQIGSVTFTLAPGAHTTANASDEDEPDQAAPGADADTSDKDAGTPPAADENQPAPEAHVPVGSDEAK